jgi:hypothetical protein
MYRLWAIATSILLCGGGACADDFARFGIGSAGGAPVTLPDNVVFIASHEHTVAIGSECARPLKPVGGEMNQTMVSLDRDIDSKGAVLTQPFQSAIMHWVASYLNMSERRALPCIEHAPSATIAALHRKNAHSNRQDMGAYDDAVNTIYLPERWTASSPADISILVHQMVYHVQNLAGFKYECSWERERLAFAAQEHFLRSHGTNLWKTFEIDRAIFLLSAEFVC